MNYGMMWFDNDPKTALPEKVARAAEYYRTKYGRAPDLCLVNPAMVDTPHPDAIQGKGMKITVRAYRLVLPGHLWLGVDDKIPFGAD